jgi:hypothetical protein
MEQAKIARGYVQSKKRQARGKQVRVGGCISFTLRAGEALLRGKSRMVFLSVKT